MIYALFIDDERFPENVTWEVAGEPFRYDFDVIARNMEQVQEAVHSYGFPSYVSFDHDLGKNEPTGKDIANWLIHQDLEHGDMPEDFAFSVHSMNPVGAENIMRLLTNYMEFKS